MKNEICPVCAKGRLIEKRGLYETNFVDRGGVKRTMFVKDLLWEECDSCGEAILDDAATRAIETARRDAVGLLSAVEIRELRLSLGKTQLQMSDLLGIGAKTYCRWESGAYIQSIAFDNYLRLVRRSPQAIRYLEDLANGCSINERSIEEVETTFPSLKQTQVLEESAGLFTALMENGALLSCLEG